MKRQLTQPPTHLELNSRRGMRCHVPAGIQFQQGRQWKAAVHSAHLSFWFQASPVPEKEVWERFQAYFQTNDK